MVVEGRLYCNYLGGWGGLKNFRIKRVKGQAKLRSWLQGSKRKRKEKNYKFQL